MANFDTKSLLIHYKNEHYKLLNYKFMLKDGSLVFTFPRKGNSALRWNWMCPINNTSEPPEVIEINVPKRKGHKITYHTSGQINYDYSRKIYSEPLFDIKKFFPFTYYSIPSIELLYKETPKQDSVTIDLGDNIDTRITFTLGISPWNEVLPHTFYNLNIRYEGLFALHLIITADTPFTIPKEFEESHFVFGFPNMGLCERIYCSPNNALTAFHQKFNRIQDVIIYTPNSEGIYRLIYATEMRVPPQIEIEFEEDGYMLEIVCKTKAYALFRVKDKYGNRIKREVKIKSITLDAEL